MKTIVPANPIKIYQRHDSDDEAPLGYTASNIAFIILDGKPMFKQITFVTISGTQIPDREVAFARVLIDGAWVSHD
jgi:hypothetical protein